MGRLLFRVLSLGGERGERDEMRRDQKRRDDEYYSNSGWVK